MSKPTANLAEQVDFAIVTWHGLACSAMAVIGGYFGVPRVLALTMPGAAPPGVPLWFIHLIATTVAAFTVFGAAIGMYLLMLSRRPAVSIGPRGVLVPALVGDWIAWESIRDVTKVNLKTAGYRPALILDLVPGALEQARNSDAARVTPALMRWMQQLNMLEIIKQSPGKGARAPHVILSANDLVIDMLMIKSPTGGLAFEQAFQLIKRHLEAKPGSTPTVDAEA